MERGIAALAAALLCAPAWAFDASALRERLAPLAVLDVPVPALGQSAPAAAPAAASGHYLDVGSLDIVRNFPAPPAGGSAADRADFAALHRWQDSRSEAECARAQSESKPSYENMFGSVSPIPVPLSGRDKVFFSFVAADAGAADYIVKNRYRRLRPFLRDATLTPCIDQPKGFAYPSGHATLARVYGRILSDLVPARSAEFMARADEAGLDRVIGGVHHPSDIAAGKVLGDGVYEALKRDPDFNSELESLRQDLAGRGLVSALP